MFLLNPVWLLPHLHWMEGLIVLQYYPWITVKMNLVSKPVWSISWSSISGLKSEASIWTVSPEFMCIWWFWICLCNSDSLLYILFTCEHKDAKYICWRLIEVWKLWIFLKVASFRNLKSFSRVFLKSSKWKCRSCKSSGIVWCWWKFSKCVIGDLSILPKTSDSVLCLLGVTGGLQIVFW